MIRRLIAAALLALGLAGGAMAACTVGGAPNSLLVPNFGDAGSVWSTCLKYDLNYLSTAAITNSSITVGAMGWLSVSTISGNANGYIYITSDTYQTSANGIKITNTLTAARGMFGGAADHSQALIARTTSGNNVQIGNTNYGGLNYSAISAIDESQLAARLEISASTVSINGGNSNNGFVCINCQNPATSLDVGGQAQFGPGVTKSTFTSGGNLLVKNGVSAATGTYTSWASVGGSSIPATSIVLVTTGTAGNAVVLSAQSTNSRGNITTTDGALFYNSTNKRYSYWNSQDAAWVEFSTYTASAGGTGDMVLASTQTSTGAKIQQSSFTIGYPALASAFTSTADYRSVLIGGGETIVAFSSWTATATVLHNFYNILSTGSYHVKGCVYNDSGAANVGMQVNDDGTSIYVSGIRCENGAGTVSSNNTAFGAMYVNEVTNSLATLKSACFDMWFSTLLGQTKQVSMRGLLSANTPNSGQVCMGGGNYSGAAVPTRVGVLHSVTTGSGWAILYYNATGLSP